MSMGGSLEEWLFVAGYISFLLFVVWGVVAASSRQD